MLKSSIGNTPLRNIPEINEMFGLPNLRIKDESTNPTGTMKDRRSVRVVEHLKHSDEDRPHVCLISGGNGAMSIKRISNGMHLQITAIVSRDLKPHIGLALEEAGIRILPTDLQRPLNTTDIQNLAKIDKHDNPVDVSTNMHSVYGSIVDELTKERQKPDFILAPFGTGEAVYGIAKNNYRSQTYSPHHAAKVIGVKPAEINSYADKLSGHVVPYREWLNTEFSSEGYEEVNVTEQEIIRTYQEISALMYFDDSTREFKPLLKLEPSSAAPFAALRKLNLKPDSKVVVVNSGQGLY